jgi:protein involved in polysaccharide export with SLBB domain
MTLSAARLVLRHRVRHLAGLSALVLACLIGLGASLAQADDYRLGPQDKVRIKVVEWRPGNGEAVEWEALSDSYAVTASGRISMPMLGEFDVDGRTSSEVAAAIGAEMQKRVGLATRPEISVEVETYRPIYILGSVEKPGDYPYRPNITTLQAVGIAGGFYRAGGLQRDRISAEGLLESSQLALQRGLIREARLKSELADRVDVKVPKELEGRDVQGLVADEEAAARARAEAFTSRIKAADSLKALLDEQIKTLDWKIASQNKQVELSKRELQTYASLTSQGLALSTRQFALERSVAEAEARKLDFEMAALNARQDRQKADQTQNDVRNERRTKILAELTEIRGEIEQNRSKVGLQESLMAEANVTGPTVVGNPDREVQETQPIFILTRRDPKRDTTSTTVVSAATALEPGDVLQVQIPNANANARRNGDGRRNAPDRRSSVQAD